MLSGSVAHFFVTTWAVVHQAPLPMGADETTLMAESEKELKSLLMKVKEESVKVGLKLNI